MYPKLVLTTICVLLCLMATHAHATTFICDEFDDNDVGMNTSGIGNGFEAAFRGTANVVEEEGLIKVLGGDGGDFS